MVAALGFFLFLLVDRRRELKMIIYSAAAVVLSRLIITEIIRAIYPHLRPFRFIILSL